MTITPLKTFFVKMILQILRVIVIRQKLKFPPRRVDIIANPTCRKIAGSRRNFLPIKLEGGDLLDRTKRDDRRGSFEKIRRRIEHDGIHGRDGSNRFRIGNKFLRLPNLHGKFRTFGRANSAGNTSGLRAVLGVPAVSD